MPTEDILSALFTNYFGIPPEKIMLLPASGGDRRYFRLTAAEVSAIGVEGDSLRDCEAFIYLSRVFRENGVLVPEVYVHSDDMLHYIQQDLGDISLFSLITSDKPENEVEEYVCATLRNLVKMQTVPRGLWKDVAGYGDFSRRQILWDLNYFKYDFLKPAALSFDEELLEDDFERLADDLLASPQSLFGFMMRDCQSRNVMISDGSPWFIDFQGGRFGPMLYDAVSFLWQAKADFPEEFRRRMLAYYAGLLAPLTGVGEDEILGYADMFVLFRTLQVLGAYGFRGLVEKRAHFIESIPFALANLKKLLCAGSLDRYPELRRVCEAAAEERRFFPKKNDTLEVTVFSFSYKKGYPEDLSGNGGGFMFDCRGMHNPGRYDEYKPLTGLDHPVIEFLKERGEADLFAEKAFEIVAPSVERYIQRGFSSLQVGFGCTGGRHRSVYCAERVAAAIAAKFPEARVHVIHREQKIEKYLR